MTPASTRSMSKARMLVLVQNWKWKDVATGLAQHPALVGQRDKRGRNWLHICCSVDLRLRRGKAAASIRTARALVDAGLDVNEPAFAEGAFEATPLWFAIAFGQNLALAKHLLQQGSSPNHCLWAAINRDNPAAIRLLWEHGARDPSSGGTSLLLAAIGWNKFAAAEALLKLGADANVQDANGMTALHHLLEKRADTQHVRMLLEYGARADIGNANGVTAAEIMLRKHDAALREMAAQLVAGPSGPRRRAVKRQQLRSSP